MALFFTAQQVTSEQSNPQLDLDDLDASEEHQTESIGILLSDLITVYLLELFLHCHKIRATTLGDTLSYHMSFVCMF